VPRTAYDIAASVLDPELPVLTLADLGVLRRVEEHCVEEHCVEEHCKSVTVAITPTYSGCPALATMRDDLVRRLTAAGYAEVRVEVELSPAWSSDWISARGRQALAAAGISPPGPATARSGAGRGPVPLTLTPSPRRLRCPRCGSTRARLLSEFGATACQAVYRCEACLEPFGHVKEI
jgi:ring-1,2-phenylacetyl-CoA epoxidase subunit PaaD